MNTDTYKCQICGDEVQIVEQPTHMERHQPDAAKGVYLGANEIARVFGTADALDEIDAVTAVLIVKYIQSRPALGKADTIALVAISELAEDHPDRSRQLMNELFG